MHLAKPHNSNSPHGTWIVVDGKGETVCNADRDNAKRIAAALDIMDKIKRVLSSLPG